MSTTKAQLAHQAYANLTDLQFQTYTQTKAYLAQKEVSKFDLMVLSDEVLEMLASIRRNPAEDSLENKRKQSLDLKAELQQK